MNSDVVGKQKLGSGLDRFLGQLGFQDWVKISVGSNSGCNPHTWPEYTE